MSEKTQNTMVPFPEYIGMATSGPFAIWDEFGPREFKQFRQRLGLTEPQMSAVLKVFPTLHLLPFSQAGIRGGLEGSKNAGSALRRHHIPTAASLIYFGIKSYKPGVRSIAIWVGSIKITFVGYFEAKVTKMVV